MTGPETAPEVGQSSPQEKAGNAAPVKDWEYQVMQYIESSVEPTHDDEYNH